MKRPILSILLIIAFAASGLLHIWEYRKIQEISSTLKVQAEIEFKRTSLMVIYQEVLQSLVQVVDDLVKDKGKQIEASKEELQELLDSMDISQPAASGKLDFNIPENIH